MTSNTYAYAIIPFFHSARRAENILECTPQPLYNDFAHAVESAANLAEQIYNHSWNTCINDYICQRLGGNYDINVLERQAIALARRKNIIHVVSNINNDSKSECMEHGNVLAFKNELAELRARQRQNIIRFAVFLCFLISAYGYFLINWGNLAVFTLVCGINVSLFLLDPYITTPRNKQEGIWIARVQILPPPRVQKSRSN